MPDDGARADGTARPTVAHAVYSIAEQAAGTTQSVLALCQALSDRGWNVELHVLDFPGTPSSIPSIQLRVHRQFPRIDLLGVSYPMCKELIGSGRYASVIHVHGLWRLNTAYAAAAALRGAKLVLSPRGMMEAAALHYHGLQKKVYWNLLERYCVRAVDCLHATSEQEYLSIRRLGIKAPVAVVSNGVGLVDARDLQGHAKVDSPRELLCLSRIHPFKGIERLIRAWVNVQETFPGWRLRVVGPDSGGYLATLKNLATELGAQRLSFEGPVFGRDKARVYASASVFVLPSDSENFGNTVAEALSAGVPAVVTKGAPWSALETMQCGWWVSSDVPTLTDTLKRVLATPADVLEQMGRRGRAWMQESFSWSQKAAEMASVYSWLAGQEWAPSVVRLD